MTIVHIASITLPEISEASSENHQPFNESELEEEFFLIAIAGLAVIALLFSKSRIMSLGFNGADLSPQFPPPKKP